MCCKIYFIHSDDPQLSSLKAGVLRDYLEESKLEANSSEKLPGLAPIQFCRCGQCSRKKTLGESVCCKSFNTSAQQAGMFEILLHIVQLGREESCLCLELNYIFFVVFEC